MRKLIDVLVVFNFVFAGTLTGLFVYGYVNQERLAEEAKERMLGYVQSEIGNVLPGMLDGLIPEVPDVTGGAIPTPSKTGPALPF